jgi:hypothetical protein
MGGDGVILGQGALVVMSSKVWTERISVFSSRCVQIQPANDGF